MKQNNNEIREKTEKILKSYLQYSGAEEKNIPYEFIINELTEMVEGELRGYHRYIHKIYKGTTPIPTDYDFKQYLLERKK